MRFELANVSVSLGWLKLHENCPKTCIYITAAVTTDPVCDSTDHRNATESYYFTLTYWTTEVQIMSTWNVILYICISTFVIIVPNLIVHDYIKYKLLNNLKIRNCVHIFCSSEASFLKCPKILPINIVLTDKSFIYDIRRFLFFKRGKRKWTERFRRNNMVTSIHPCHM